MAVNATPVSPPLHIEFSDDHGSVGNGWAVAFVWHDSNPYEVSSYWVVGQNEPRMKLIQADTVRSLQVPGLGLP